MTSGTGQEVMAWTVEDPLTGVDFWVTEEERREALDKYAKEGTEKPTKALRDVARVWWLAYWEARKRGDYD